MFVVVAFIAVGCGDAPESADVPPTVGAASVVDLRNHVEQAIQHRAITGASVHHDDRLVYVYLPEGMERFGSELSQTYGTRIQVAYGPPMRPLTGTR